MEKILSYEQMEKGWLNKTLAELRKDAANISMNSSFINWSKIKIQVRTPFRDYVTLCILEPIIKEILHSLDNQETRVINERVYISSPIEMKKKQEELEKFRLLIRKWNKYLDSCTYELDEFEFYPSLYRAYVNKHSDERTWKKELAKQFEKFDTTLSESVYDYINEYTAFKTSITKFSLNLEVASKEEFELLMATLLVSLGSHKGAFSTWTVGRILDIPSEEIVGLFNYDSLSKVETKDAKLIQIEECIVKSNVFKCSKLNHSIDRIKVIIPCMNKKDGSISQIETLGGYCRNCNDYYIYNEDYKRIKKRYHILCRVKDQSSSSQYSSDYNMLNSESILFMYGYNVNVNSDLSLQSRRNLLAFIIDNKILTPDRIVSHLDWCINYKKGIPNMENAIYKWKSDRDYVLSYNINNPLFIVPRNIIRK